MKTLTYTIRIEASVDRVRETMIAPDTYNAWTSAFTAGSHYEGSWDEGAEIRFLDPNRDGMVSEIAENNGVDFISIRHLGYIKNGVDDTTSDEIRAWAPAYENYTFTASEGGTLLRIACDVTDDFVAYMNDTYPKALALLKELCEKP